MQACVRVRAPMCVCVGDTSCITQAKTDREEMNMWLNCLMTMTVLGSLFDF